MTESCLRERPLDGFVRAENGWSYLTIAGISAPNPLETKVESGGGVPRIAAALPD